MAAKKSTLDVEKGTPPGEGERRAQRGYVPQYDLGSRVIYEALASGHLLWIGVADRGAGSFDDIVLGLTDRIAAYQVKTSREPRPFSIRTALLGTDDLLRRMLDARKRLKMSEPNTLVETVYACDDFPRVDDEIETNTGISSAAFLRAHEAHRLTWSLPDWKSSIFSRLIAELIQASRLSDADFELAWRHTRFEVGGQGRSLGLSANTAADDTRLREIAAMLPRLAADESDRDRWTVGEVLRRLRWRDIFGLRHTHAFPIDALHEINVPTQERLQTALSAVTTGYVSLVGPPGCGKSTLLAAGLLPTPRATVVRYLAFVPDEGQGLGRAEAFDFLNDIIGQLKQQGLGRQIVPGNTLHELRSHLQTILLEASHRYRTEDLRTLIVVDGLDHVPREERPQESFLRELPLPQSVPEGVIFVLGTQRLDLQELRPSVADQAQEDIRCVRVAPLPREAVSQLADAAGISYEIDRDELYNRTEGHALSVRYVIESLLHAGSEEKQQEWLRSGPSYGGDIDVFYKRAWHDLQSHPDAQRAIAYVALADGSLSPVALDRLVGEKATDAAWLAAGHLLIRDHRSAWSIFHNSFRLFLRDRTGTRHGQADATLTRRRYSELADMARDSESPDPQRWMELRYRARAGDYESVAQLAKPERFRVQFMSGRNPADIRSDMDFAFEASGILLRPDVLVDVIFSCHEINSRVDALGDEVFSALIELGDLNAALGMIDASISLTSGKRYELVDAFLARGDGSEARKLFQKLEPIDQLLGSKPVEARSGTAGLSEWAERVLIFRGPAQFLASVARLRLEEDPFNSYCNIDSYRTDLKLLAARGQLFRNPELGIEALFQSLELEDETIGLLRYFSARAAFDADLDDLCKERLRDAGQLAQHLSPDVRRDAALLAAKVGLFDLARSYLEEVEPASLAESEEAFGSDELQHAVRQVIKHVGLSSWLGQELATASTPRSELFRNLQGKLELIGQLLGDAYAGRQPCLDPVHAFRATLDFLEHAEGERSFDSKRWQLDRVMDEIVGTMADMAGMFGQETLARFSGVMDEILENDPRRLGRPHVRRAFAMAAYRYEYDADVAKQRLAYKPGLERTPADQLKEAAETAATLARFGLNDLAQVTLSEMHADGFGYSRPARKDAQYIAWRDLLIRANAEDPGGRTERLRSFGRLVNGLSKTEGNSAGGRLAKTLLDEAAQAGPSWARAAANMIDSCGVSDWPTIVRSVAMGTIKRRPELAAAGAVVFGRLGLPFSTRRDESIYDELVALTPADQLEFVERHAVSCIEADASPDNRIEYLEQLLLAGKRRGYVYGTEALNRWRDELPPPKSGNSPEDPFYNTRSLQEIGALLENIGDGSGSYGAIAAFERLTPDAPYEEAKALFNRTESLLRDDRALEAIAQAALIANRRDDAFSYLAKLANLAKESGSWGDGWRGNAKQRYHRVSVSLGGEPAQRTAFDAFVDDLRNRRESVEYILPSLGSILDLLSPRPSWAETWRHLQSHLEELREYRIGRNLEVSENHEADEQTLADIVFRAFETTSSSLTTMARTAAIELAHAPNGTGTVNALITCLWQQAAGSMPLEASQIAWECRDIQAIQHSILPILQEMGDSEDLAVRRIAQTIGNLWNKNLTTKRRELPAIYSLDLPPDPQAERFRPPSGMTATSSGLYTEDVYNWTWMLEAALRITARGSGLPLVKLRRRVGQLLSKLGGTSAFGPPAVKRQHGRLRRLEIHTSYHRLLNTAAFRAMRETVGELALADAIDPRAIQPILRNSGGFSSGVPTRPPIPRAIGVSAPMIPDSFHSKEMDDWLRRSDDDAIKPFLEDHIVLAATARHARRRFRNALFVEQYFGPISQKEEDLFSQLHSLPQVVIDDQTFPLYQKSAPGAVAHAQPTISDSVTPHQIIFCPIVAAELGWLPDRRNLFAYRDRSGTVMAQTIFWRDGGVLSRESDDSIRRHGYLLVVQADQADRIRRYLYEETGSIAWRSARMDH